MPHTRLDRLTYTIYAATETEMITKARQQLATIVTDIEQWTIHIDANEGTATPADGQRALWAATVVATRNPTPTKPAP